MNNSHTVRGGELQAFIEQMEKLDEEAREIAELKKEKFAEIKGRGYDVAAIRQILKERATDPSKLAEMEAILDLYRSTLT